MASVSNSCRIVLHAFSSFDLGGQESRFVSMIDDLGPSFLHLVHAMDGRYGARELITAQNVIFCPFKIKKGAGAPNFRILRDFLILKNPSLLVTYNFGAFEWVFSTAFLNIPHTHIEEGFTKEESKKRLLRRNLTRKIGMKIFRSRFVTVSSVIAKIAKIEWGVADTVIEIIPNGVDCGAFEKRRANASSQFARNSSEVVVGTVARLRPEKNISRLLEAFSILRRQCAARNLSVRLLVIGDGPQATALVQLAIDLGIANDVIFLGKRNNIAELLREFDIFCLSSDTEQMPISLVEAMASALPAVCTNVGDIKQMVCEKNTEFVVNQSAAEIAKGLQALVENIELRKQIGNDNYAVARSKFSKDHMVKAWARIYGNCR